MLTPVARLARDYPERLAVVAGLVFLFNFAGGAAFFLDPSYLQEEHGWQPWHVSALLTLAGVGGLFASTVVGILGGPRGPQTGDRRLRRHSPLCDHRLLQWVRVWRCWRCFG